MPGIYATAGASIAIGQVLDAKTTAFVLGDFAAISWTDIGWAENLGAFGDKANEITFDSIDKQRTQKLKGTRNAGAMACVFGIDYEDDGQAALRAAEATSFNYAFKVTFNDAPSGGTPSERYFIALVMSAEEALDTANSVMKLNASLSINSNIVSVDAAP